MKCNDAATRAFSRIRFIAILARARERPPSVRRRAGMRALIVDTDVAIDDAIAFAMLPPPVLVTTVGGMLPARVGAPAALRLLLALADARAPRGREARVVAGLEAPRDWVGAASWAPGYRRRCERMLDDIHAPPLPLAAADAAAATAGTAAAAAALVEAARAHAAGGGARLVCLGPLTNVAAAIALDPAFLPSLAELVVLGGAARAAGNGPGGAEWNFWCDPGAAHGVLEAVRVLQAAGRAAPRVAMLGNEVVNERAFDTASALGRALASPTEGARADWPRAWCGRRLIALQPEALAMDPLAAAYVLRPSVLHLETAHVAVDPATGVCAEDGARGAAVQLATAVDSGAYGRLLARCFVRRGRGGARGEEEEGEEGWEEDAPRPSGGARALCAGCALGWRRLARALLRRAAPARAAAAFAPLPAGARASARSEEGAARRGSARRVAPGGARAEPAWRPPTDVEHIDPKLYL